MIQEVIHDIATGEVTVIEAPAPVIDPAEALAARRAAMRCSPASMQIVLHRCGLLADVTQIARGNIEAGIIWDRGVEYLRLSPFIDALADNPIRAFEAATIDTLFDAAMAFEAGASEAEVAAILATIPA